MGDALVDDHANGKWQERVAGAVLHFGSPGLESWPAAEARQEAVAAAG